MKKSLPVSLLSLFIAMVFLFTACGAPAANSGSSGNTPTTASPTTGAQTQAPTETTAAAYEPVKLVDQGGFEVTIPAEPKRIAIAGLPPFPSFLIQFTGRADIVVAASAGALSRTPWADRVFPGYTDIPVVGMGPNYEVEEILATKPDLIICGVGFEEKYQALRESGIPTIGLTVVANGNNTIENVKGWITILGQIFHQEEKAVMLNQHTDELKKIVDERVKKVDKPLTGVMLPDYNESIIEVSNDTFFGGYWLASAGLQNVAKDVVGWESNMEEILNWNPDVVYLSAFSKFKASEMLNDTAVPGHKWSSTSAGQNGRIVKFPEGIFNWYALSPDAPLSMIWIASNAYPELYKDVDLAAIAKKHYVLYGIELTDAEISALLEQQ